MKVYEGARGLDGAIVIVDGKPLPRATASPHLGGIRLGTDGSNLSPSSGESCANLTTRRLVRPGLPQHLLRRRRTWQGACRLEQDGLE